MITEEKFIELIEKYYKYNKSIDIIDEFIPGFFESTFVDFGWYCFEELLRIYFNKEGKDWIDYYLYDNPEKCYYMNNEVFPLENLDDLWELIKEYRI